MTDMQPVKEEEKNLCDMIDAALKKPLIQETSFVAPDSYLNVIRGLMINERARLRQQNHVDTQLVLLAK